MATDSVLVDGFVTALPNTIETMYNSPSGSDQLGTLIKAVTASNPTKINASYKMYIVNASGDTTKPEIPFKVVVRLKTDLSAPVINHVIPVGGSLRVETSAADSISFRVTGVVLS